MNVPAQVIEYEYEYEYERETDGRWIAEIPAIPGAMAYGATREEAIARAVTSNQTD